MSLLMFDSGPSPAFSANFLSGVLPAGLTYTNSSTTRTYFGSDGLLKTAAANAPIFEYNPVTLALLGMRWEMEQRTNLCLYSTLSGGGATPTGWTFGGTGTSAPVASIYGNADGAVAYLHTATAQRPYIQSASVSLAANTTYTMSMLIESRSAGLTPIDCMVFNGAIAGATISYPACQANPSGGSGGLITTGVLEIRIVTAGTAGTATLRHGLGANANTTGTLQFSRPQFEAGASRSSFIPTTTAAVTRQPDVLTASSISWYRQDEGTVLFEGIASDFIKPSDARGPFIFHDGTNNNAIGTYFSTTGSLTGQVRTGGVSQYTGTTVNTTSIGVIHRILFAYKTDNFGMSLSGGTVQADASGTIPTITQLRLGTANYAGASSFMGYARRFDYYRTRFPDATIQGMSRV